jgi:hypothetical protein
LLVLALFFLFHSLGDSSALGLGMTFPITPNPTCGELVEPRGSHPSNKLPESSQDLISGDLGALHGGLLRLAADDHNLIPAVGRPAFDE